MFSSVISSVLGGWRVFHIHIRLVAVSLRQLECCSLFLWHLRNDLVRSFCKWWSRQIIIGHIFESLYHKCLVVPVLQWTRISSIHQCRREEISYQWIKSISETSQRRFAAGYAVDIHCDQCTCSGIGFYFGKNLKSTKNGYLTILHFVQCAYDWSHYVVTTDLPKYMNDVIHVSVHKNGIYSAMPRVISLIVAWTGGCICDWMMAKTDLSITNIRKTFVITGNWIFDRMLSSFGNP